MSLSPIAGIGMVGIWRSRTVFGLIIRLIGAFLVVGSAAIGAKTRDELHNSLFNVGYQVLDLKYRKDGQEKTLTVAVWYPTAIRPKPHNYGGPTRGKVAVDAAPDAERGPYPLFVFSHGYGGSGIGAVFLTEALAARGWIVAAPDHHDRYSAVRIRTGEVKDYDRRGFLRHAMQIAASSREDRGDYMYRLDEIQLVLDRMLISDPFGGLIDPNRIAVGGHSFGGFTALGVCGTIPARFDSRIKVVLLFSTGAGGYLFSEEELAAVRMPSMLFLGEREKDDLRGKNRTMAEIAEKVYRNMPPPKYFLEVKGANHLSFNNEFTSGRLARSMSGNDEQIFDVIRRYSIAFLEKYVAGRGGDDVLKQSDPMLTRYAKAPNPDMSRPAPKDAKTTQ
jgi:predicted dienelactone hydrolase